MARSLQDVISEISAQSDPQRQRVLGQINDLPGQQATAESALEAKKNKGLEDIMLSARRRGVAYWGAPIAEQNEYFAGNYMPALANLQSSFKDRKNTLEDALDSIGKNDYMNAYNIFNTDRQFEESQRQFNEQMAESRRQAAAQAAAMARPTFGSSGLGSAASAAMSRRNDGGFNFTDANGRAISAAQYAAAKGINFRNLLQTMASQGDKGAATLLGFVGNDYGYDPRKIGNNGNLYNAFVWGTGRQYNAPKPGGGGGGGGW